MGFVLGCKKPPDIWLRKASWSFLFSVLPIDKKSTVCAFAVFTILFSGVISAPYVQAQTVVATVNVGGNPQGVGVNTATNKIYVSDHDLDRGDDTVSVIDGSTDTVTATVTVGDRPFGVGVNTDTNKIYVANVGGGVSVIDGSTDTVTDTVNVGSSPRGVGVNTDKNKIYVTNDNDNTVSVIDGSTDTVTDTVTVGTEPRAVGVNADTNKIYVVNRNDDTVSVIDGSTDTVTDTVNVGGDPRAVGVNADTNKIYVANNFGDTVSVIDGSTDTVTATVTVGGDPRGVGVNADTNRIYVANQDDHTVSVIDGSTDTVTATVTVGGNPRGVGVNADTDRIYVANSGDGTVSVISDPRPETDDSTGGGDGCRGDCTPPTLGVDTEGKRIVTDGFSYNGHPTDVELYYTPYPLITVTTGESNTARFKIYDNMGPGNIVHLSFAFGLGQDQVISQSKAAIELDIAFDGTHTVSVTDPQNALDNINVTTSTEYCTDDSEARCLVVTIRHSFREQLDFDMVGTDVWDSSRNAWQNYYNHGVHVTGESLNPPDTYSGVHKGHIYHLTETGKNSAVDQSGDSWTYDRGAWAKDYVKSKRPEDGAWKVMNRYHSGFAQYKEGQITLAEQTRGKMLDYESIQNDMPSFVAGPTDDTDKRQSEEFLRLVQSEKERAAKYLAMMYIKQNCLQCLEEEFSDMVTKRHHLTQSGMAEAESYLDPATESQKAMQMMQSLYRTSDNWSSE